MPDYLIQSSSLDDLADKIRSVAGGSVDVTPSGMRSELDTFENAIGAAVTEQDSLIAQMVTVLSGKCAASDSDGEDAFITRSNAEYTNTRVTIIGSYAFQYYSSLTSVNFPAATSIGVSAFHYCTSLISVNFPVATSIGTSAFNRCSSLISVNFPVATSIGSYAFSCCSSLTSVNFPVATSIDTYTFYECSSLTSVNFPAVTSIGPTAFGYCSSLTSVNFPVATSIGYGAFSRCTSLSSLTLGASTVCKLVNSNAFYSTPIATGTGYIYVPSSLVASYQAATNWTYFSSRISGI